MKKGFHILLTVLTAIMICGTLGFHILLNRPTEPAEIRYPLPKGSPQQTPDGTPPVDLNTAEIDELMTLPGIGAVYAQRILEYRELHGGFTSVADLLQIEGFGTGRLERILDYITVGGQHEDTGR